MPPKTDNEEAFAMILIGIIAFFIITGLLIAVILYYQKKRFLHNQQLAAKEEEYTQQLLQSKLEIQEQTFDAISSEIHDNVGQILSLAKVQLNIIGQQSALNISLLNDAKESIGKALADLRDIAKSLNSNRIHQLGLFEITQHELHRIQRSGFMNTGIEQKGVEVNIRDQKKLIIFRIIQECLQNIIKHSQASIVNVSFNYQETHLTVIIADNGKGFDSASGANDGQGLQNIIIRSRMLGGNAQIDTRAGHGTTIIITSPYG